LGDLIGKERRSGTLGESNFRRVLEDFECRFCGESVKGSGYTNHCPKCLWSSHVDVNPGDRAAGCNGLMMPSAAVYERGDNFTIVHKCLKCGVTKRVKAAPKDNRHLLAALQKPGPLVV